LTKKKEGIYLTPDLYCKKGQKKAKLEVEASRRGKR
jgi:hypothetical protein